MSIFILAYLAGVLTIASPCIFPILPIVLARANGSFRQQGLPLLVGLALSFAAAASLASVAGAWATDTNRIGRAAALIVMALFGLALIIPGVASRLAAPLVLAGGKLADVVGARERRNGRSGALSILLGIAMGLVWAPCAGPVLGLILSGAAFYGPGAETFALLLAFSLGAATSLAMGMLAGGMILNAVRSFAPWIDGLKRALGVAVIGGAIAIWTGLDTRVLAQVSLPATTALENGLIGALQAPRSTAGAEMTAITAAKAELTEPLASLISAKQWLNSPPLKAKDLRGKVVLVNFWTYSCINCLRVLPHVRAWAEKYRDQGLVVVGVHTPEFAFEKDVGNVTTAVGKLGVDYPVAIDNDFRIWRAFANNAWPALYFADGEGRIRHQAFGEGNYAISEEFIRKLLRETGDKPAADLASVSASGTQVEADLDNLESSETYLGYAQARGFTSPGGIREDAASVYRGIDMLPLNRWTLSGSWTVGREYAQQNDKSASITYRFHARDLHLVMGPMTTGKSVRFRVTIDGRAPGENAGTDVDAEGFGTASDTKLYQLIRQTGKVADRTFEIEFLDAGARAYAFTFG